MKASLGWLGVATSGVLLVAFALAGCGDDVSCGSGTHQVGGVCVADDTMTPTPPGPRPDSGPSTPPPPTPPAVPPPTPGSDGGPVTPPPPPPPGDDGGTPPPPPPMGDGGIPTPPPPPPGDGGMPMSTSCTTPEMCAAWSMELVAAINAHRATMGICGGAAYTWNDGLAMTARRNSEAMAASDSLTGIDMLFAQAQTDSGLTAYDGGAAFSGTRLGPMDVLTRWLTSPDIAGYFANCNLTHIGAGFATGASTVSYGTIIIFDTTP